MRKLPLNYLALGDSYTIGESVPESENFPNATVKMLRLAGHQCNDPKIIATTGWTTDELAAAIDKAKKANELLKLYDIVSLLIGVNDQYRGRSAESYERAFEELLGAALNFAGNNANLVFVLSIPDWGVTPYASGRDRDYIATQIDSFNVINSMVSARYGVTHLDITGWTREAAHDPTLLARDGLHPSGKEYARWAQKLSALISQLL